MKRLAVFLDGTWNDPEDNTSVWRLKLMVAPTDRAGVEQRAFYDTGVGTRWGDRFLGGAFGKGLSKNIREAYGWLMENYAEGDEIFIFGFSRGAYTARSLAGMISQCGLLTAGAPLSIGEIFDRYAKRDRPLYHLRYLKRKGMDADFTQTEKWLLRDSKSVSIHFIGVWDTVGSLGIPFGKIPGISRKALPKHFVRPSKSFKNYVQALAIDEHRKPYRPSLWTEFIPHQEGETETEVPKEAEESEEAGPAATHHREQRWFIGAHANVGGGYKSDPLCLIPLHWIQEKAIGAGLHFNRQVGLAGDEHLAPVADSFGKFLFGLYRVSRLWIRFHRKIGEPDRDVTAANGTKGKVRTVNETVDESALKRWREDKSYRPKNLQEWAERTGTTL